MVMVSPGSSTVTVMPVPATRAVADGVADAFGGGGGFEDGDAAGGGGGDVGEEGVDVVEPLGGERGVLGRQVFERQNLLGGWAVVDH
jgi:hypothetical protein